MQRYLLNSDSSGAYSSAALNPSASIGVDFVAQAGQQISFVARPTDAYGILPVSVMIYDPAGNLVPATQSYGVTSGNSVGSGSVFVAQSSGLYSANIQNVGTSNLARSVAVSVTESGSPAAYLRNLHPELSAPARFTWTDTTNAQKGTADGQSYAGPVNYLQWQYLWAGQDSVNVNAAVSNAFLKGGPGTDALAAQSGSNVLDGNTGSNFLVGAAGTDGGTDTFFVDGRGDATTWSTAVNFHHGDSITFWGFNDTQSAYQWAPSDGAAGYQGATIHAETAGAGTPVNASLTFAGMSLADAQGKLAISTGSAGGEGYMYVKFVG